MRILSIIKRISPVCASVVIVIGVVFVGGVAAQAAAKTSTNSKTNVESVPPTNSTTSTTTAAQQRLANIISKGDQEITRRINNLTSVQSKITATTKLTASDQSTLSAEVSSEISGLTALKAQLDSSTTVSAAIVDVQDMFSEYRVYALVLPKVDLVKTSDDQLTTEGKLTTLAQKLQTRITAEKTAGKDVTTLQADLNAMTSSIASAQGISNSIENTTISLQPSDYDSNHSVLSGDVAQLKTALADEKSAYGEAKTIIEALKS